MARFLPLALLVFLACRTFGVPSNATSCEGQCESKFIRGSSCQCNSMCSKFGDCCPDYTDVCLSCRGRCGAAFIPQKKCQCNTKCPKFGNCCDDFTGLCGTNNRATSSSNKKKGMSNRDLKQLSEKLFKLAAKSGISSKVRMSSQGLTNMCNTTDKASRNLLTTMDQSIWQYPTVAALKKMFDNYNPDVTATEDNNPQEQSEETKFLGLTMETDIMKETYKTLLDKNVINGTMREFRTLLQSLWFKGYDRDGTKAKVIGSSGFEHVFMGESKGGNVSGFHNWLKFLDEENKGRIDYLGHLADAQFRSNFQGITNVFKWNGQLKCISSMLVGTPPELDFAMFTTCFLARRGRKCYLRYNGKDFYITAHGMKINGKDYIGTAYPDFP
ncbi:uridylate-specific endoribonuclease-like isoform X1 [Tigriopus californicus]|uniref:uridylate-specific endoribonuclease-like isoform X1 n=2 Tax=Tigriopus californicus TaxID=6832 RepID=UPI0027DA6ADC|nr:uridylate-specific endoribonuclease-like isoform X1 [Tigriopus californicus]